MIAGYNIGQTIKFGRLYLTLEDVELLNEDGTCGEDNWLYHWRTNEDRSYLTTDIELAGMRDDISTVLINH